MTVLGVVGAVAAASVVLHVQDDVGVLRVSALVGVPCVMVAGSLVSMRGELRVLVAGVVVVAGLALVVL